MFTPALFPKTVGQLHTEADEEAAVALAEDQLRKKFEAVREHCPAVLPIGVQRAPEPEAQQQTDDDQDDEGTTDGDDPDGDDDGDDMVAA